MTPTVRFVVTEGADQTVPAPAYQSAGAAGADVRANLDAAERPSGILIPPGGRALVPTGLRLEIPAGFEAQIRPRSGLALKHGITLANSPGTIDADYRGPLGVILINLGAEPFLVAHADRIAQIVISPVVQAVFDQVATLDDTMRGAQGFGSTGRN